MGILWKMISRGVIVQKFLHNNKSSTLRFVIFCTHKINLSHLTVEMRTTSSSLAGKLGDNQLLN